MAKKQHLDFNRLLPSSLKNETLTSLVSNLFNRFVAEEKSVLVDGRIGKQVEGDPQIYASNLEREVNALVPALYVKTGTEESAFTFEDFVNRLDVLNADSDNMREWMAEQYFNFHAPIDYDKFVNFGNYYWVGQTVIAPNTHAGNPNNEPEYYTIARPAATSKIKMPTTYVATQPVKLTGTDRENETLTIRFTSSLDFVVTSTNPVDGGKIIVDSVDPYGPVTGTLSSTEVGAKTFVQLYVRGKSFVGFGIGKPYDTNFDEPNDALISFTIQNGAIPFSAEDRFIIDLSHRTSSIFVSFQSISMSGKGALIGARSILPIMYLNGERIARGARVLVTAQADASENGIYVVDSNAWKRAHNATNEDHLRVGSRIFVYRTAQTFEVTSKTPLIEDSSLLSSDITFTAVPANPPVNLNPWQIRNNWYHKDDFTAIFGPYGVSIESAVQAKRPIIEYNEDLQLNSSLTSAGIPVENGEVINIQQRFAVNQPPQFDLFRYDGTHAGITSSIFFYVEDPDFEVDEILQRRLKTTADYDYVFGHGLKDEKGRLLFYKKVPDGEVQNAKLETVWVPGVSGPVAKSVFLPNVAGADVTFDLLKTTADVQTWTLTFVDGTFKVVGERSGNVGNAVPGTAFECDDFVITISPAAYADGDVISFNVMNKSAPRYVKKTSDGNIINYPGGIAGDTNDAQIDGAWMTPLRMFQNLERETRSEMSYGDIIDHVRSMIRNQDGFQGGSLGVNNVRNLAFNPAFGGTIRDFDLNFPLFAGMLIQKDLSPITLVDFAEQQYNVALSSVDQFITERLPAYISAGNSVAISQIAPFSTEIQSLLVEFERLRAENENLREVFGDTTAKIPNWPATLPMLGLIPAVQPDVSFDFELGINIIVHHDGHISPIIERSYDVDRELVKTLVLRSDGTTTAGYFSEATPNIPYTGQLWLKPSTMQLKVFDVSYDTSEEPNAGSTGQYWFNRATQQMYAWDDIGGSWVTSTVTVAERWVPFSVENVRNSLMIAVEQKLYESVHPSQTVSSYLANANGSRYAEIELARFALKYGYDTFAPDFNQTDAFTWNYSQAVIPGFTEVPARWYDIYKQHFDNPGQTLSTCRPNLEPWKLLNFASKPPTWDALYASTVQGTDNIVTPVRVAAWHDVPALSGLPVIDGVQLANGDRVLLFNQFAPETNGIYVATSSGWVRSPDALVEGMTVGCLEGFTRANTVWTITTSGPITPDVTPVTFQQIRLWNQQMWIDIKTVNPWLKLCVNVYNDAVIPPYVSTLEGSSNEALLTSIPSGISNSYSFGDNGPVEIAWKKSLEYLYGLARSAFRLQPLKFLSKAWGDTYVTAYDGGVRLERNLAALQPHTTFLMHGERLNIVNQYDASEVQKRISGSIAAVDSDDMTREIVFEVSHVEDNLTIFSLFINGQLYAYVEEGVPFSITVAGLVFTNVTIDDLGIPFELSEKLVVNMYDDVVDTEHPDYVDPDLIVDDFCEGCVADGTVIEPPAQPMKPVDTTYTHTAAAVKKFKGLGQWFTNLLRFSFIDTEFSAATQAYREWQLKLAHRIGALIRQDTLSINTAQGVLPPTAYHLLLKKNANTESLWITGLRVQLVSMGARVTNKYGFLVPKTDASDWTFRIESYNIQNPTIEKYVLDTNGDFQTFNALAKVTTPLDWKRYTEKVSIETVTTPQIITGLQNVLNFIYGYIDRLYDLGWKVYPEDAPVTDAETGRNLDWQLEVEKLVDRVYKGMNAGEGHILNPFMSNLVLSTPRGLMARYSDSVFIDTYSAQGAYDVNGSFIPVDKLHVIRTDEGAVTYSNTPIFSAHVFIDEYEHAILFNKKFSDVNGAAMLFDPFLGARIRTAYLTYIRQEEPNGKPTFEGFFLSGNNVSRNIVSSVDASASYYDAAKTFYEPTTAEHALALLGYRKKSYFDKIAVNSSTQFNFWRGLIQAKGTNMTIDAFVNYKKFNDASVDEYWAFKIAEYGDAREKTLPELKIEPTDTNQKYLRLQFYANGDGTDLMPLFTHVENGDDTRWFSIDDLGKGMRFEAVKISEPVVVDAGLTLPAYVRLNNIYHNGDNVLTTVKLVKTNVLTKEIQKFETTYAEVVNASLLKITFVPIEEGYDFSFEVTGFTWINPTKLSPIKLIDYEDSLHIADIALWHPAIGIHAQAPLEAVDIISSSDPARYNYTTQTANNENYHTLKSWARREVGRVWWDTSNLGYIPYYDAKIFPNRDARLQRWGLLADWASVDLYEWIESPVPPEEYDALAVEQEGSAEIDSRIKASGRAARKKYYERDRIIKRKPIAWSRAGVGNANAHPAFGPAEHVTVRVAGSVIIADSGRCEAINLVEGRHFGGWRDGKPVGEVVLVDQIEYLVGSEAIGSEGSVSTPILIPQVITPGKEISEMYLEPIENAMFGIRIGKITLTKKSLGQDSYALRMTSQIDGHYEDKIIGEWYSSDPVADNTLTVSFETFGLKLHIVRSTFDEFEPITPEEIIDAVTNPLNDIYIREAIRFEEIIPLPDQLFVNDETNELYSETEYEWKTWEIPTQDDLNSDLAFPFNAWKPYPGDEVIVSATQAIVEDMNRTENILTLRTGEKMSRYSIYWTPWESLDDVRLETISTGIDPISFTLSEQIDSNRVSVYVNGIQVNPSGYVITNDLIQIVNIPPEGSSVLVLYRAYVPSDAELAFDPEVLENFTIQKQYKFDYQYTVIQQRDADGNLSASKYYFWVQDKTIPQVNKNMSLAQAQDILTTGPSTYAVLARALPSVDSKYPAKFDSCAIAGLSQFVTKDNAFKLRFIRDFTLRDDPEEINLKNTHSEWKLIRKSQGKKIPAQLWELVTTAAAGIDAGGNTVPSQARVDYDLRNGARTRFGFGTGQIFADTELVQASILNTVLNTQVTLRVGKKTIIDYITALDFSKSDEWFATPEKVRETMSLIYNTARASQVNEIFFAVLEDALANNFELSDIFKTSYITVSSSTTIVEATQVEQEDELY